MNLLGLQVDLGEVGLFDRLLSNLMKKQGVQVIGSRGEGT